ncbi:MAG: signal peptidase I [Spirochaetales bacterium]|nr:signal peptidase I [Spirochaetales bacterium]
MSWLVFPGSALLFSVYFYLKPGRTFVRLIGLALLCLVLIGRSSCRERLVIAGRSMEPLFPDGGSHWLDKTRPCLRLPDWTDLLGRRRSGALLRCSPLERGAVVAFEYPSLTGSFDYAVKRIIAGPGDSYELFPGGVAVAGELLKEPYASSISGQPYFPPLSADIPESVYELEGLVAYSMAHGIPEKGVVPQRTYLLLGDNRMESRDSRSLGFIPEFFIRGQIIQ